MVQVLLSSADIFEPNLRPPYIWSGWGQKESWPEATSDHHLGGSHAQPMQWTTTHPVNRSPSTDPIIPQPNLGSCVWSVSVQGNPSVP